MTIVYAIVGIPLTFLYLSNIGNFMADCFRLFYKRVCCDVCCCQQCARKHEKLRQQRRREIAAQRNEIVVRGRPSGALSPEPEEELVKMVTIGAAEGRYHVMQPGSADVMKGRVPTAGRLVMASALDADRTKKTGENYISGFDAFANIRETDIVDDETSLSLSASRNDFGDTDVGCDVPRASDEARRYRPKTDAGGDPAGDVTTQYPPRCETSKQASFQSRVSSARHCRKRADDVESKFEEATSASAGRLKRQKTIHTAREKKVKRSSKLKKSQSLSQADASTNSGRARRLFSRHKPATESGGVTKTGQTAHYTSQSTNSDRLVTRDGTKSAQQDGKEVALGRDAVLNVQLRSVSAPNEAGNNRKLLRSHSSKLAKTEKRTLRRNVTVTETDARAGGLSDKRPPIKIRRQAMNTPLPPHDSVESVGNDLGASQDSFVTAHGDSLFHLDAENPGRSSSNRRPSSDDDDDDVSLSYNNDIERRESMSTNGCRCKQHGAVSTDDQGPIVFGTDEDDVAVLGHESEAKVSVPIYICVIIIAVYIIAGSALFATWEQWDYLTGSYFCFITLSTIGFGDVVPGTDMDQWSSREKLVLCALWLAFGLSLLAMCFNLMQEEVKEKCKRIGRKLGLLKADK